MPYVIRSLGLVGVNYNPDGGEFDGQYLVMYDPEYAGGAGGASFSPELRFAKRFETIKDAVEEYNRVSELKPVRPDGKPNRPLTAHSVEIVKVVTEQEVSSN